MTDIALEHLLSASRIGGPSSLSVVTELGPAAGPHAGVAPGRYVDGNRSTYLFQTRYVDDEAKATVCIDGKGSSLNRVEEPIALAVRDGVEPLSRTPRLRVKYADGAEFFCLELPHRAFDGHFRAGTIDGAPATSDPRYRAIRDASPSHARALLEASPQSIVFGSWDSTRRSHQGRYRSALVGEIIGVLADQSPNGSRVPRSGGARVDPYAASVQLKPAEMEALVAAQEAELSPRNVESIRKEIAGARKAAVSGSSLGLGAIPPSLDGLGVVACSRIIRSYVLSFSTLRGLRFDAGVDGDAACRALLAAFALAGLARAQADPRLRANCDLVELEEPVTTLDARYGNKVELAPISIEAADALLAAAIEHAEDTAGIAWNGQILDVVGNPVIAGGTSQDGD